MQHSALFNNANEKPLAPDDCSTLDMRAWEGAILMLAPLVYVFRGPTRFSPVALHRAFRDLHSSAFVFAVGLRAPTPECQSMLAQDSALATLVAQAFA